MARPLANILNSIPKPETSGPTGALVNFDGAKSELMTRLRSLATTGQSGRVVTPEEQTGLRAFANGAGKIPAEFPALLAEDCMTKRLPPCVQSHLTDMEMWDDRAASTGEKPPKAPTLSLEQQTICRFELAVLDQILSPAFHKGEELVVEVSTFFSMMPFQKGDESEKRLKINGWCTQLEHYPLYAIKRALGWRLKFGKKEPSFAEVLEDVKLFTGDRVLSRRRMLEQALRAQQHEVTM